MAKFHPKVSSAFTQMAREKRTGALICETKDVKRLVFLEDGELVGCRSDVPEERFGHLLVVSGFLTEPQLDTAVAYIRSGKKLGEIMVELGYFNSEELARFVRMQVRNVASAMLFSAPTRIGFSTTLEIQTVTECPVSFMEVFLHGALGLENIELYRTWFEDNRNVIARAQNIVPWYRRLAPEEAAVWDVIDGRRGMREIVLESGLPEEMVLRTLIGLTEGYAVEILQTKESERELPLAVAMPNELLPDLDFVDEGSLVESEPVTAADHHGEKPAIVAVSRISITSADTPEQANSVHRAAIALPKAPPEENAAHEVFLAELRRLKETVLHGNHWETLGLSPNATKSAVLSAFHNLCSRFHPDVHAASLQAEHLADLNFVFARVHEAFRVLSEKPRSESYTKLVDREAEYEQEKENWSAETIDSRPPAKDPLKAQQLFGMALEAYRTEDFWRTIQLCRRVLEHGENEPDYYYLLGKALSQNPRWRRDAEENLKIASKLEPWNTKYLITLGELYRREGLDKRAERTFLTAQIIDPDVRIPEDVPEEQVKAEIPKAALSA